uniref:Serine/threonine-protein phosphatase 5 n=1 Tax=Noccaea caerulescens TaxID=107243 RepID=A0A1J3IAD2_NOCCA
MCDLLWADPTPTMGRSPSKRGASMGFGENITKKFLQENKLSLLIRSHEVKHEGYEVTHDGKCITIFSAPNYCDFSGNSGAYIRLNGKDLKPKFIQFSAVPHPAVGPMAYASQFRGMF